LRPRQPPLAVVVLGRGEVAACCKWRDGGGGEGGGGRKGEWSECEEGKSGARKKTTRD
jgi:hypothetical protein